MDIIVTHDGQEISVPIDNLKLPDGISLLKEGETPDGFMPSDAFQAEVDRSVKRKTKGLVKPDEVIEDDDFFRRAAQKRGIELSDDLKPVAKIDPEVLKRYKTDWAKEVEPDLKERDELLEQNQSLKRENERAKTQAKLLKDLKPDAFEPQLPGMPSTFESIFQHFVKFDEDGRAFFQTEEGSVPEYDLQKAVFEYVKKHNPKLLADTRGGSSGLGDTNNHRGTRTYRRSEIKNMSDAEYERNRDDIMKAMEENRIVEG